MCLHEAGVPTLIRFQAYLSTANVICLFIATANVLMCVCVCVCVVLNVHKRMCIYVCVTPAVRLCLEFTKL